MFDTVEQETFARQWSLDHLTWWRLTNPKTSGCANLEGGVVWMNVPFHVTVGTGNFPWVGLTPLSPCCGTALRGKTGHQYRVEVREPMKCGQAFCSGTYLSPINHPGHFSLATVQDGLLTEARNGRRELKYWLEEWAADPLALELAVDDMLELARELLAAADARSPFMGFREDTARRKAWYGDYIVPRIAGRI